MEIHGGNLASVGYKKLVMLHFMKEFMTST